MGHQESCARKVSQQTQDGQGHEVVESAEQQTAGVVVDGSPALTKYVDDLTISYRGMNHIVANVITEALSLLVGWLETGWTSACRKMRKAWKASRQSW